jgi:ABC-2 type transport system ATP-binding protein
MKVTRTTMAIETTGLGKRFGPTWALQDCTIRVPQGRVSALVGPNGAGKTTLLRLLVGLRAPSAGQAWVLGRQPGQDQEFLGSVGYLAQEAPLYKRLTADEHLDLGAHLNLRWDKALATDRLRALRVPLDRPVATLSGGQRSQVALGLALAKRPQVLLLDEPVAALDPLARQAFLSSLAEAVAGGGLTVVLSSHLLHDLERVCDHVILLAASRAQLSDDIDVVLESHKCLVGPRAKSSGASAAFSVVKAVHTERQSRLLVHTKAPLTDPAWDVSDVGLEEVVLAYMSDDGSVTAGSLSLVGGKR